MKRCVAGCLIAAVVSPGLVQAVDRDRLLYHAETLDGTVILSRGADRSFNPASVVKVATSGWALEQLGPDHRFETLIGYRGTLDGESGILDGQLVMRGSGDPDFHLENLFLIAIELNRLGVRRVSSGLELQGEVTVGWEHGAEGRSPSTSRRRREMGRRVRDALEPRRWNRSARNTWKGLCDRRGLDRSAPGRVRIDGGTSWSVNRDFHQLLTHRSNRLPVLLRRFNVYSNNDIVRFADNLGGVARLETWLQIEVADASAGVQLETASGEGRNRMTARGVVSLLRSFKATTNAVGLKPRDFLAVPGCDPGPIARMFPKLAAGEFERLAVVKTGTLRTTDGGVAVLAGYYPAADGSPVVFCVAAPRAGAEIRGYRRLEQQWLLSLMKKTGRGKAETCKTPLPFSDDDAILSATGTGE